MSAGPEQYLLEVVMAYAATALIVGGLVVTSVMQAKRAAKIGANERDEKSP